MFLLSGSAFIFYDYILYGDLRLLFCFCLLIIEVRLHWQIVRLLANHPQFHIKVMTADRKASEQFGSVFPHLITQVRFFLDPCFLVPEIAYTCFFKKLKGRNDLSFFLSLAHQESVEPFDSTFIFIRISGPYCSHFADQNCKTLLVIFWYAGPPKFSCNKRCRFFKCWCGFLLLATWNNPGCLLLPCPSLKFFLPIPESFRGHNYTILHIGGIFKAIPACNIFIRKLLKVYRSNWRLLIFLRYASQG